MAKKNFNHLQPTGVCLKIGCIPNYSHLIGIMIINHWLYGYTIFRHTHSVWQDVDFKKDEVSLFASISSVCLLVIPPSPACGDSPDGDAAGVLH